jgi:hypothetical protein
MRRIKDRAGIDFKFHDLRRTAASHMTALGIPRLVVSKVLNHVEQGITAVYDRHGYDNEKRTALLKWDGQLLNLISSEPAKNVSDRRIPHQDVSAKTTDNLDVSNA